MHNHGPLLVLAAGVDVDGRQVSFEQSDGSKVTEGYDLLVGADGVGSAVRTSLQQYYPDMSVVVTDSGREYKTYKNLRGDIEPDGEELLATADMECCC
jgi:2-polyprenyl-6-methoxyphenol hydroxylase-like FAD-dependent oxidoreductase